MPPDQSCINDVETGWRPRRGTASMRWFMLLVAMIGLGSLLVGGDVAHADANTTITVTVLNRVADAGKSTRDPVPGVTVNATAADGTVAGTGVTDAKGVVAIDVGVAAKFTVSIDEKSLPSGVAPASGEPTSREVDFNAGVSIGAGKQVTFFLGKDTRTTQSRISLLPQTLVNGVKFSLLYAMAAIGLSLIYGTTGLSNFAHGELVTLGAVVTWYLNVQGPRLHLLLAALFGVAAAALAGGLVENRVWRPLRRRGMSLTSMMIMSIGMAIAVRYIFLFYFGGRNRRFRQYVGESQKEMHIGSIGVTPRDLTIMIVSIIVVVAVCMFLLKLRLGKAIRAVSDNPDLASATGIDTNRIILLVWLVGGGLAGLGGVMFGAATGIQWDMGFNILLILFAAITVGGLGNPFGALLGAFIV
ncbi:MAG: branched-chain amino acid ABC transporter permease, partial [Ilumatobacteraceae bacterium]